LYGLPERSGKLKELNRFDASFFGVHPKQAHVMDPSLRIMHELTYESIVDAGKHRQHRRCFTYEILIELFDQVTTPANYEVDV